MEKMDVSFQIQTSLDDSTFLPLSTVSETPEFRNLFAEKPITAIIYLILLCFISFWGGATNILILIVHILNKKLNKAGRIFLVNLCLADLCVSIIAIPFCIIGVVHGEEFFKEHPYLCRFIGSFCFSACICAILNLSMATINRYTYVCHNQFYIRFFNSRTSLAAAIFIWIIAFIIDSSNILGWGGHTFDKKNHSCIWDRMASFTFTLFVSVILIIIPLLVIFFLNFLLLRRIHATKFNICMMRDVASMRTKRNVWMETLSASRTLLTMCVVFLICWVPYAAIVAFDVNDTYPEEIHLFITLLAHSHSAANFTLYWLCNKEFSKTVCQVFRFALPSKYPQCFSASSAELSSTSSSVDVGHDLRKRKAYSFCQNRKRRERSESVISTSVEVIRRDISSITSKEDAQGSFKGGDHIPDSIYTIGHCDRNITRETDNDLETK